MDEAYESPTGIIYTIRMILLQTVYAAITLTDMNVLIRVNESSAH